MQEKTEKYNIIKERARVRTRKMHFFCIFFEKNLHMSKKSSTFAPAFEK